VLRTLNPQQNGMVTTISEIIIPQTDTPGAKAARVNEFIDLILTEWYDDEEKSIFLTGLAEVDTRTRDLFGNTVLMGAAYKGNATVVQRLLTAGADLAATNYGGLDARGFALTYERAEVLAVMEQHAEHIAQCPPPPNAKKLN